MAGVQEADIGKVSSGDALSECEGFMADLSSIVGEFLPNLEISCHFSYYKFESQPDTTSIPRLKVYIFFRKSNKVKFDQIFRRIYQQI
jgi:hypothetical protein